MDRKGIWIGAVLALLPALAPAADGQVEAARQCAQQKDSLQRLVCYDGIFQADADAPETRAAASTVAPAAVAAAPAVVVAPAVVAAAPSAAAVAPVVAPAAAPIPAPAAAPALGDESVKKKDRNAEAAAPRSLEAKVTSLRESRPETFRVTLDNGQTWQQMESSSLFHVKNGDTVRIEKGSMGGYRMALAKGSGWVRVTRVE